MDSRRSTPPPDGTTKLLLELVKPLERTHRPVFEGLENLPDDRPLLFVGNHVVWSGVDMVLLAAGLLRERGIRLRPLGDRLHFRIPIWREIVAALGAVEGTRPNCARLMQAGECILVFPGGAREVAKRRGEKYQLLWGERVGFAKMALENGCTVIPFGTVGGEEMWDIVLDADDVLSSPVGPLVEKLVPRKDFLAPIVTGHHGTPLPKPVKMYFRFEAPLRTADFATGDGERDARALRDRTREGVERALARLLERRAADEADET